MGSTLSSNRNNYKNQSISLPPKLRKIENRDQQMKKEKKNNRMNILEKMNIFEKDYRMNERETGEIFEGEDAIILNRMADEMDRRKKKQEQEDVMQ
jgi:hypothetical protein